MVSAEAFMERTEIKPRLPSIAPYTWRQGKKFEKFSSPLKCIKYWEVVNSRNEPLHECMCPFFVAGFQKEDGSQGYDSSTFS